MEQAAIVTDFRAMNTDIELYIYSRVKAANLKYTNQRLSDLAGRIKLLFFQAESCLSRFRPESELSRLNAAGRIVWASPLLFNTIAEAVKMAELTEGIFDPTILKALEHTGYDRSFELIGKDSLWPVVLTRATINGSYRDIKLEPTTRTITLNSQVKIDLGGIAKGMTVDRAAQLIRQHGFDNFMVNAGGDMYISGSYTEDMNDWPVGVLNPITLNGNITTLRATNSGVATSATTKRSWGSGGRKVNHLIDPRTNLSVDNGLAAVSVIAPTTRQADILAKTALILGPLEGRKFIEQQSDCKALFISYTEELFSSYNEERQAVAL